MSKEFGEEQLTQQLGRPVALNVVPRDLFGVVKRRQKGTGVFSLVLGGEGNARADNSKAAWAGAVVIGLGLGLDDG